MDGFKEAWLSIDKDGKGVLTTSELAAYMKQQGNDDGFVRKWMRVLDSDGSGKIDVDSFCDTLGINIESMRQELHIRAAKASGDAPPAVQFVSGDMDPTWQAKVTEVCLDGLKLTQHMKDTPKWIKGQLDNKFGLLWHVVIVNGEFWCYYGHEPGFSYVFRHGKHIFIVYKTPSA